VELADSIKSFNTTSVGTFSGFSNSGKPLTNETFCKCCGALFSLHQTIFLTALLQSCSLHFNPSALGHLNPSSYCDVGRLFYGVFKFWAKLCRSLIKIINFVNTGWISIKLETKYLGMSKLFKYPIKSYLKNLTWCEMP